jgi:hypothetical protein
MNREIEEGREAAMNTEQEPSQEPRTERDEAPRPRYAPRRADWTRDVREVLEDRRKSPVLAAVMSAMPGLGQIYVGYYQQGFTNALLVGALITALNSNATRGLEPLMGLFLAFFWLYNVVDAARRASLYNQALAGLGPSELPEDVRLPRGQGSVAGGAALIALGLLIFSNTMFGVSLDWVEQWWPMALVGLGAYLVYVGRSKG